MYNHYIRIDENNNIIKVFSSAFEQSELTDILYKENVDERHFNLDLISNNSYFIQFRYKWSGTEIIEKTQLELDTEITAWKNDINNKTVKAKQIRREMLGICDWVNGLRVAQEYGHASGKNKKPRVLPDILMDDWAIWFEDMTYWLENTDLNTIDYDDIYFNSTIFPTMPEFPNDIMG